MNMLYIVYTVYILLFSTHLFDCYGGSLELCETYVTEA